MSRNFLVLSPWVHWKHWTVALAKKGCRRPSLCWSPGHNSESLWKFEFSIKNLCRRETSYQRQASVESIRGTRTEEVGYRWNIKPVRLSMCFLVQHLLYLMLQTNTPVVQGGLPGEGGPCGGLQLRLHPSHEAQCRASPGLCQCVLRHFVVDAALLDHYRAASTTVIAVQRCEPSSKFSGPLSLGSFISPK